MTQDFEEVKGHRRAVQHPSHRRAEHDCSILSTKAHRTCGIGSRGPLPFHIRSAPGKTARVLALVNVAMADGFIAGFRRQVLFQLLATCHGNPSRGHRWQRQRTVSDMNWSTYPNTPAIRTTRPRTACSGGAASEVLSSLLRLRTLSPSQLPAARRLPASRAHFRACRRPPRKTRTLGCMRGSTSARRAATASSGDGGLRKFTFTHYLGAISRCRERCAWTSRESVHLRALNRRSLGAERLRGDFLRCSIRLSLRSGARSCPSRASRAFRDASRSRAR